MSSTSKTSMSSSDLASKLHRLFQSEQNTRRTVRTVSDRTTSGCGVRGASLFKLSKFYFSKNHQAPNSSPRKYSEYKNLAVDI
mmetsp:Transcript_44207/g.71039  ORF Transcript_44207/g.71039 Transcript_44207/m.71039 type:complete len:83 (+) Transcript_44207:177-425(+)